MWDPHAGIEKCCSRCAGEINTLQGNLNWVSSREHSLTHPVWAGREADFLPLTSNAASDSANLDMMAEFLVGCLEECFQDLVGDWHLGQRGFAKLLRAAAGFPCSKNAAFGRLLLRLAPPLLSAAHCVRCVQYQST